MKSAAKLLLYLSLWGVLFVTSAAAKANNVVDDHCKGQVDATKYIYYRDADKDGFGDRSQTILACAAPAGYVEDDRDCDDLNAKVHPLAKEVCNEIDDNCNNIVDEGAHVSFYADKDGDGYGNADHSVLACSAPDGYVANNTDCNDSDATMHPTAAEMCNNIDDDCNGIIDDGVPLSTYYEDKDGDGFGSPDRSVQACFAPPGYALAGYGIDCNDESSLINPASTEKCNGIDDNCNGVIDDGIQITFYRDLDGDGYGNAKAVQHDCVAPEGYVADATDCDDNADTTHPGALEICNGADDNCDGTVDEGVQKTYFQDNDGDGHGNPAAVTTACSPPAGYVNDASDCDDNAATTFAGAVELCNGIDDNCNSQIDEGVINTYYFDGDNDGYGNPGHSIQACAAPARYVAVNTDCDDANATIHPGAVEVCNGIDDNCNGAIDDRESGVICRAIPTAPQNVAASDLKDGKGKTSIEITWAASENADYYVIYRSAWDKNAAYHIVANKVIGTSFTYKQSWDDVYNQIGAMPAMVFTSDMTVREPFINSLDTYMTKAYPILADFKAPAYFKIQACNDLGCSAMSRADVGQAAFIHTSEFSELAELFLPLFQYPMLKVLATMPMGQQALGWCGADLCGPGGGMVMARIDIKNLFTGVYPQIDIYYENYTGGWGENTTTFNLDGYLGGMQVPADALNGLLKISGDFEFQLPGGVYAQVFAWVSIDASKARNEGYFNVTYNNNSYQFNLPLQPTNGKSAGLGPKLTPASEIHDDLSTDVEKRATDYPNPLTDPLNPGCTGITAGVVQSCTRIGY